jgi:hypothetical protein
LSGATTRQEGAANAGIMQVDERAAIRSEQQGDLIRYRIIKCEKPGDVPGLVTKIASGY